MPSDSIQIPDLVTAAFDSGLPIDISSQPALWGGMLRGTNRFLTCISDATYEDATDENHAMDLVQSGLIGVLSAIGRESIDIYFLRVRKAVEEYQISGALQALELARQEGHIKFLGLCCDGSAFGTLAMWQFHDAFDLVLLPRNHMDSNVYQTLAPLAKERRVGVITSRPLNWGYGISFSSLPGPWKLRNLCQSFYGRSIAQTVLADLSQDHPVMVGVKSANEISEAVAMLDAPAISGLSEFLEPFREAFLSDEEWVSIANSEDLSMQRAATRRALATG